MGGEREGRYSFAPALQQGYEEGWLVLVETF